MQCRCYVSATFVWKRAYQDESCYLLQCGGPEAAHQMGKEVLPPLHHCHPHPWPGGELAKTRAVFGQLSLNFFLYSVFNHFPNTSSLTERRNTYCPVHHTTWPAYSLLIVWTPSSPFNWPMRPPPFLLHVAMASRLPILISKTAKHWEGSGISFHLQAKMLTCHGIIGAGRRHKTPRSETKNNLLLTAIEAVRVSAFLCQFL